MVPESDSLDTENAGSPEMEGDSYEAACLKVWEQTKRELQLDFNKRFQYYDQLVQRSLEGCESLSAAKRGGTPSMESLPPLVARKFKKPTRPPVSFTKVSSDFESPGELRAEATGPWFKEEEDMRSQSKTLLRAFKHSQTEEDLLSTLSVYDDVKRRPSSMTQRALIRFREKTRGKSMLRRAGTLSRIADVFEGAKYWLEAVDQPPPVGRLARVVTSAAFDVGCTFVIILDSIFTSAEANRSMVEKGEAAPLSSTIVEIAFSSFYLLELILKLMVFKRYFFCNLDRAWNWFDLLLVVQAWIGIFMQWALSGSEGGADVTFMRLVKLVKLGKILRIFRAVRFLTELRVMLMSVVNCLTVLGWAFIMLGLIMYVFAVFFVQLLSVYVGELDEYDTEATYELFGSVFVAMLSLFQASSGGRDWFEVYYVIHFSGVIGVTMFIFFMVFFQYAVVNILGGIFLEKAIAASQPDRESLALAQRRMDDKEVEELKALLTRMDKKGTGMLTTEQFLRQIADPMTRAYLRTMGLEINDAVMFFRLIKDTLGTDELSIEDFVKRLGRMKGGASALDLQTLAFEVSIVRRMLDSFCTQFEMQSSHGGQV
eukprot:TRINITY_DN23811_c0_g1_i1.p1 TRINITY_DN23811_c0_g1~~TRINITY_DN23811_c0_g1_i1.p1  ORF type:complete len:605 (-),score=96.22 TRINITY_DN23811_c0_g1_i1:55-1848(-)